MKCYKKPDLTCVEAADIGIVKNCGVTLLAAQAKKGNTIRIRQSIMKFPDSVRDLFDLIMSLFKKIIRLSDKFERD